MKIYTALAVPKGKVLLISLSIMVILVGLTGCISEMKNDSLLLFTSELNNTENIEYNGVQTTKARESQEKQYIHVEYMKNPFSLYQRIGNAA